MNVSLPTEGSLNGMRPQQYPHIDINPVFIQYMFSFIIILLINIGALYQFSVQMWRIYSQTDLQSIIHDVYDKTILHTSLKYVCINTVCILYFHDLTSPPVQIVKIFWLYFLVIVFMKFEIKQILWPSVGVICLLLFIAWIWIFLYGQLPAFKLILVETLTILYFGTIQCYQITKILNIYNKDKKNRAQLSLQRLLAKPTVKKSRNDYDSIAMNVELDENINRHLQNRRSFCIVFCCVLVIDLVLLSNLKAGKQLLGQVILSVVLDILPLYVVFWYLRKSGRQRQEVRRRKSRDSQNSYHEQTNNRTSNIVIEMVNLKN